MTVLIGEPFFPRLSNSLYRLMCKLKIEITAEARTSLRSGMERLVKRATLQCALWNSVVDGTGVHCCRMLAPGATKSEVTASFIIIPCILQAWISFQYSLCWVCLALTDLKPSQFRLGVPSSVIDSSSKFLSSLLPPYHFPSMDHTRGAAQAFFQVQGKRGGMRSGRKRWIEAFTLTRAQMSTFNCI